MSLAFTIAELTSLTGAKSVEGVCAGPITGIAALAEATSLDLSFLGNAKYAEAVAASKAGAILVPVAFVGKPAAGQAFLRVDNRCSRRGSGHVPPQASTLPPLSPPPPRSPPPPMSARSA